MPKIPTYQPKAGLAVGQLGARANQQTFTQVGRAYAQLGQQVTRSATAAAGAVTTERKRQEAEKAKQDAIDRQRLAQKKALAKAQSNAAAKNLFQTVRSSALEAQTEALRDNSITSIQLADERISKISADAMAEIDSFIADGLVDDVQGMNMKTDHAALMSSISVNIGQHGFNNGQKVNKVNFDNGIEMDKVEARTDPSKIPGFVAKYNSEYESNVLNGLNPMTPDSYELSLHTESVAALVQDEGTTYFQLLEKQDEIDNAEGIYETLELGARSALSNILQEGINEKKIVISNEANVAATNAELGFSASKNEEQANRAMAQMNNALGMYMSIDDIENVSKVETKLATMRSLTPVLMEMPNSSAEDISDSIKLVDAGVADAIGTDGMASALSFQKIMKEAQEARDAAIAADSAQYSIDALNNKYPNSTPTRAMIVEHQESIGVPAGDIKVFTVPQVTDIMNSVNEAQSPEELNQVLAAARAEGNGDLVMRQLRENGLTSTQMFVSANPNSPISAAALIASTSDAVTGANAPTKTQRKTVSNAVMNNEVFRSQVMSMGGSLLIGMTADDVYTQGVLTPDIQNAMDGIKSSIVDTAIYLAIQDGQSFGENGISTPEEAAKYVDQAVQLVGQNYTYTKVNEGTLRLPKAYEGKETEVADGIDFMVRTLNIEDVYYEHPQYKPGEPEYDAAKQVYFNELMENYQVFTVNGDRNAIITDKVGGAVRLNPSSPHAIADEVFNVSFANASSVNQLEGRARLKDYNDRAQALAREIRDHPKKGEENQEKIRILNERRDAIIKSYNSYSRYLRSKDM